MKFTIQYGAGLAYMGRIGWLVDSFFVVFLIFLLAFILVLWCRQFRLPNYRGAVLEEGGRSRGLKRARLFWCLRFELVRNRFRLFNGMHVLGKRILFYLFYVPNLLFYLFTLLI